MLLLPPLSLYIHFPWCVRKCPYCDFNSHVARAGIPEENYIAALLVDLDKDLALIEKRPLISIFMGGGTPSLFSPSSINNLLIAIKKRFDFTDNIEITLEANPGTVEYQRFADFRAAGVNRLSMGIQSFQSDKLKTLGRIHNDQEARQAVEAAQRAGFENFNLDLMHGLPNQSLEDALFDIETALSFKPAHLSWYQLTIEPNTFFARKPPRLPTDESIWEIDEKGRDVLASRGFTRYEISAYSQPGKQCIHNHNYWEFGDYFGIGAGAHGKITDIKNQTIHRTSKIKNPKQYMDSRLNQEGDQTVLIAKRELAFEFVLNALRLYQPIPTKLFEARTGLPIQSIKNNLDMAQEKNLLSWDDKLICQTELGQRFYNDLVELFI